MPVDGRCREVFGGEDRGRQARAHDLRQIAAREQLSPVTMGDALLGQEQGRDHEQGHVTVPRPPVEALILGHAAGALGLPEGLIEELARSLLCRQTALGKHRT